MKQPVLLSKEAVESPQKAFISQEKQTKYQSHEMGQSPSIDMMMMNNFMQYRMPNVLGLII